MFEAGVTHQHQVSNFTKRNRHPEHIALARAACSAEHPRVLSFGCSTGEECFDIRDHWPSASVFGTDINQDALKVAKSKRSSKGITFFEISAENLASHGPFDAIFAMNVLCRNPETIYVDNISEVYPFHLFDMTVSLLAKHLTKGSVLAIYNGNYFFEDTSVADQFEAAGEHLNIGFIEKALPDGTKAMRRLVTYNGMDYPWAEYHALKLPGTTERQGRTQWISDDVQIGRSATTCIWRKIA
jgi:SAM-dependent methyltransferase